MTRKKTHKTTTDARNSAREVRDWRPLFERLTDTFDWALDITIALARGDTEEIEAIERVREYLHSWLQGDPIDIDMNDVCTTLAILFAAIELDVGIDSSPVIGAMRGMPVAMRLPGAQRNRTTEPTVVIRRPRRRNAIDGFTYLAA